MKLWKKNSYSISAYLVILLFLIKGLAFAEDPIKS